jgi:2-hydroxy-4-carboxymuconate semialdehyde hemiacetal dehydrogenase
LVGPGAIGEKHLHALRAAGADVAAVVGPDSRAAAEFAARHEVASVETDVQGVVSRDDIDAVVISSPSPFHAGQSLAALDAGKHVLCEIPVGLTLEDARNVAAAAEHASRQAMVCHTTRFWTPALELRRLIDDGSFSARHVIARSTIFRQANVGWTGVERDWVDDVLWHHGAHLVDTALWLLGEQASFVSGLRGPDWPGSGKHMDVGMLLATSSGRIASLSLSYHARIAVSDYLVIGEEETFEIRDGKLWSSSGVVVGSETVAEVQDAAIHAQDKTFVDAVASGTTASPSVVDVLPAMEALAAVEERGRRWTS